MQALLTQINQLETYLDHLRSQIDLTYPGVIIHNDPNWGLCMIGKIRAKGKCPVCGESFENVGDRLLICKEHYTIPSRYFIDLCWMGKQRRIYSDNDGRVLTSFELANRVLTEIRQKIEKHSFDPADYVAKKYESLQFPNYARKWVSRNHEMYMKGEVSKITWLSKKNYTESKYIPFFGKYDIRDIRAGDIEDFYCSLPAELQPNTKKCIMRALRALFKQAKRRHDIKELPDFPTIVVPEKKILWIDEQTQERIFGHIPAQHKGIFLFMFRQGVRPGEARALKYEDIDRKARTVTIHRTFSDNDYKEYTKTKKVRVLPLDDEVYEMLCSRDAIAGFVFTHNGRPYVTNNAIRKAWIRAIKKAGLDHIPMYNGTRHSFASQAVNSGVPLNLIQDFLGHTSENMTRRYAHIDIEGLKLVIEKAKVLKMKKKENNNE